jgi:hypothetical protein
MNVDPVYAMIERHKVLSAAYDRACHHPDYYQVVVAKSEALEVVDRTGEALDDGAARLLALQPLTLSGVVAMLRYLAGLEDWQLPGHFTDDFADMQELCTTLAAAIVAANVMKRNELEKLRAEVERLQAAKRAALAIADERSKQNVELRHQVEQLRAQLREQHR